MILSNTADEKFSTFFGKIPQGNREKQAFLKKDIYFLLFSRMFELMKREAYRMRPETSEGDEMMKLTEKETTMLKRFGEGMDEPNCGWLHEMGDGSHSEAGVLGSLIEKGLVRSDEDEDIPDCYWIQVTELGQAILAEMKQS